MGLFIAFIGFRNAGLIAPHPATIAGTSTVVSYIESAARVAAGGRSGVTAIAS